MIPSTRSPGEAFPALMKEHSDLHPFRIWSSPTVSGRGGVLSDQELAQLRLLWREQVVFSITRDFRLDDIELIDSDRMSLSDCYTTHFHALAQDLRRYLQ